MTPKQEHGWGFRIGRLAAILIGGCLVSWLLDRIAMTRYGSGGVGLVPWLIGNGLLFLTAVTLWVALEFPAIRRPLAKFLPLLFLDVLVILLTLTTLGFATGENVADILVFAAVFVIMGIGMTFVIVSGGIDLSVGSVLAFSSVIGAWSIAQGVPIVWGIAIGAATGTVWGLVNGTLITVVRLPPFVATLATMGMARGFAHLLAQKISGGGTTIEVTTRGFDFLGSGQVLGFLPTSVLVMAVVVAAGYYVLNHMRLGRYTFAIGSNVEAARYSGIPVKRYTLLVYLILGALSGLAGMMEASMLRAGDSTLGDAYELQVIAAVVIGGGSLSGGQGTVLGTLTGALIMGVIKNGCILLGVSFFWQLVVISVLIIIAVAFDTYQRRRTGA